MGQDLAAYIQVIMHPYGDWTPYGTCINQGSVISMEMENIKRANPDWRVRAVDSQGRVLDILT